MLSIDEAIERLKCMRLFMQIEDSENDSKFLEDDYIENDMAIEALEELKEARKGFNENRKAGYKHGYSDGYEKGVDDFVEKLKSEILEEIDDTSERQKLYDVGSDMSITCSHIMGSLRDVHHRIIDEVAQQLKEGDDDA